MDQRTIPKKLRALRKSKDVTLGELAEQTGLTKGYLSRIENSENPPPISTLGKIATALGSDITDLFPKVEEPVQNQELAISRNHKGTPIDGRGTSYGYSYENLALEKKGKNMEPFIVTVGFDHPVNIRTEFCHQGEEFLYVLEGTMEFFLKGKSYILEQGDSVYFDADIPHSGKSVGNKKAKLLIVIYSYKRF
jgi:transcriptional regulator with XRE-family HTH domain